MSRRWPGIALGCDRTDLSREGRTDDVLVGYDFEQQHEDGDQVQEVSYELEDVHRSRVVRIL